MTARTNASTRFMASITVLLAAVLAYAVFQFGLPALPILSCLLVGAGLVVMFPRSGIPAAIVAIYANLAVIAVRFHGAPASIALVVPALLMVPLAYEVYVLRRPLIVDRTFGLMLSFLVVLLAASLLARDPVLALDRITGYVMEGLLLYLILINVIRDWSTMRVAVWALLITAAILSSFSVYQEVSGAYSNEFAGLSQRRLDSDHPVASTIGYSDRAHGPMGEPNRYAQVLLMLLPLAFVRSFTEKSRSLKVAGACTGLLIVAGVLSTYSRGGFLAVVGMVAIGLMAGMVRFRTLETAGTLGVVLALVFLPAYVDRVASIGGVGGLVLEDSSLEPDRVTRSRLTEMAAAFYVFADHPVLGVGPGHYAPHYSVQYQLDPDIALKHISEERRAHNLYLEMAAETGILGLVLFMAIVLSLVWQLFRIAQDTMNRRPRMAWTGLAFVVGILGYLMAGMFLHLSFERYYWLMLAMAGAMLRLMEVSRGDRPEEEQAV